MLYDPKWNAPAPIADEVAKPPRFALAPIDRDFAPYSKRPRTRLNEGLFVDGGARRRICVCR
jgi:hypothetical protein